MRGGGVRGEGVGRRGIAIVEFWPRPCPMDMVVPMSWPWDSWRHVHAMAWT